MRTLAVVAALAVGLPALALGDEAGALAAARKVLARDRQALVTVRLTIKQRRVFEGREHVGRESTLEVLGTVIRPDGLTVISDFTSNPEALFRFDSETQVETETTEVAIVLQDGRELPARFVLRDAALDLAFLAPAAPTAPLPFVKLEKVAIPQPLDEVILLSQLGRSLGREVGVTVGRVRAVVKKPRVFAVPAPVEGVLALGGPAFDARGRPVGLVVLRRGPGGLGEMGGVRDLFDALTAVVLSAADVQELAAQAVQARARQEQEAAQ
jgi:hypothetical protein